MSKKPQGAHSCRCVRNPKTKRGVLVCKVPKSKKHRSGTVFAGKCD